MTPAQLFGVAVRTIGVLVVLVSGWAFLVAVSMPGNGSLILAVTLLLLGLWLVRGAKWLIAFAYPGERGFYPWAADKQSPATT